MANKDLVYAEFFLHPVKDEIASKKAGRLINQDVEHIRLRFAANKQTQHVAPAHEVFKRERNFATGEVTELTYAMAYNDQYRQFKNGEAQTQGGTPLSALPFLGPSKQMELKALSIHTAEALASLDGQPLKQLGMGGRELKNQAQAFIDLAKGSVDVASLSERLAALEAENALLRGGRVLPPTASEDAPPSTSPFADWEDEDIKNWIKENGGAVPRGNAGHATIVTAADELNAELAKKKAQAA